MIWSYFDPSECSLIITCFRYKTTPDSSWDFFGAE